MNKEYTYNRKGAYTTAGNYKRHYNVTVVSDNKELLQYLEDGLDDLLEEYRKNLYSHNIKKVKYNE